MKGGILRKIKSISTFTSMKTNLVFQINRPTQYFHSHITTVQELQNDIPLEMFCQKNIISDLSKDVREEGQTLVSSKDMVSAPDTKNAEITSASETVNCHSCSEFIPLSDHHQIQMLPQTKGCSETISNQKPMENWTSLLFDFEDKCPPGGNDGVILYTTSLRGIRKTFEDCNTIRFLLESFRVVYYERDVSMHVEYREELWRILGGRVVPPRLFIRGRHIGGADEVVGLHERGLLKKLLHGIPLLPLNSAPCKECGGIRFVLCPRCHGSRKINNPEGKANEFPIRCPECNENGLIKCPTCS